MLGQPDEIRAERRFRGPHATLAAGDRRRVEIIDRISRKYTGGPYPLRTDRVVYLIEAEHARAAAYG